MAFHLDALDAAGTYHLRSLQTPIELVLRAGSELCFLEALQ
jgi:hypothetical protein